MFPIRIGVIKITPSISAAVEFASYVCSLHVMCLRDFSVAVERAVEKIQVLARKREAERWRRWVVETGDGFTMSHPASRIGHAG